MESLNKQEALEAARECLTEKNLEPVSDTELEDMGVDGGLTYQDVKRIINDYAHDIHTAKCADRDAWRYEH
jgi:hypothetical protein